MLKHKVITNKKEYTQFRKVVLRTKELVTAVDISERTDHNDLRILRYDGSKWKEYIRIGSIVKVKSVEDPTISEAGVKTGMEGVVVSFELINDEIPSNRLMFIEVFINEKHVSYYFHNEQLEVIRL